MPAQLKEGQIELSNYLLTRLHQLGVKCIFGVPGDFTLEFLDFVEQHPDIEWIGNTNELNAAYAADGYARIKQSLGVVSTTFGVGELSSCNGIAGAFSERVPVLHIVGTPSTQLQGKHALLHHTLGDGRFDAYSQIYKQITSSQAILGPVNSEASAVQAAEQIDCVILDALIKCRPTYLTIPTDLVHAGLPAKRLEEPLKPLDVLKELKVVSAVQDSAIRHIVDMYSKSSKPIAIVDACAIRFGVQTLAKKLIEDTGLTFFCSPMGKTALDESHPQFGGIFVGDISHPDVSEAVDSADFVLYIGALKSDFNTASFTYRISPENTVELHSDHTQIQYAIYPDLGFHTLLEPLTQALVKAGKKDPVALPKASGLISASPSTNSISQITQDEFWPLWGSFFRPGDIVLAETGTSSFGIIDVKMPNDATFVSQILYGSIGWTGGAVLGAAVAAKELKRKGRVILFIGDGSLQLTVQELSNMIRLGLNAVIVVLNNDGYVIERCIHGQNAKYNDIQPWDFQKLLSVFSPKEGTTASVKITNKQELEKLIKDQEFAKVDKLHLVEVMLDRLDAPRSLKQQAELTSKANEGA